MRTVKNVQITKTNNTINIKFTGNSMARNDFLDILRDYFFESFSRFKMQNIMGAFFIEIIKNIYDHAKGFGEMILEEKDDFIYFQIKDFGKEKIDLETIGKIFYSTKKHLDDSPNRGIGMGMIYDVGNNPKLVKDFFISDKKGLCYSGKWIKQ